MNTSRSKSLLTAGLIAASGGMGALMEAAATPAGATSAGSTLTPSARSSVGSHPSNGCVGNSKSQSIRRLNIARTRVADRFRIQLSMAEVKFNDLKQLLIKNCMLRVSPDEIQEETPLFGPESLGLDSIDALQMTVAIERDYGIAIKDPDTARLAFHNLSCLKQWLKAELEKTPRAT